MIDDWRHARTPQGLDKRDRLATGESSAPAVGGGGVGGGSNVVLGHLQSLANSSSSNCGSGGVNSGGGGGGGTDHTMVAEIEEMVDRQASKNLKRQNIPTGHLVDLRILMGCCGRTLS